jgi:ABC-type nitrate/sulfonate/bicarbonate transport system substrate-binding protein
VLNDPAVLSALARAYRRGQETMREAAVDAARIAVVMAGEEKGAIAAARAEGALAAEAAIRRLPLRPYDTDDA